MLKKSISALGCVLLLAQAGAALAQQVCPTNLVASAPNSRYTVLANTAEVRDNTTGLVWQRCALGQSWSGTACTGAANTYNFNLALIAANVAGSSGGFAWRLPNINEVKSLVDWACHSPSLNQTLFPITLTLYPVSTTLTFWTSTSEQAPSASSNAWSFGFHPTASNNLTAKSSSLVVRLVRSN